MDRERKCGLMIKYITTSIEKEMNALLKDQDLTMSQSILLMYLRSSEEPMSMKDLEKQFHLSQPTVVGLVKRAEMKGLITSSAKEGDKRVKLISITDAGLALCEEADSTMQSIHNKLTAGMTEKEAEVFEIMLSKACLNFGGDLEHFEDEPKDPPPMPIADGFHSYHHHKMKGGE